MNVELVKKFAELRTSLRDAGVMSVNLLDGEMHVSRPALEELGDLQIEYHSDSKYPYEIFTIVEGIKLFGLATAEYLTKFPQLSKQIKEQAKADLRKQLDELVNKEETTI
jgi:hypothetical protein